MKKIEIDYYSTSPSKNLLEYDEFDIIDKTYMKVMASSNELNENFDIFLEKNDLKKDFVPIKTDLIFFINEFKFYSMIDYQDAGDFYLLNIKKCKMKK